MQNRHALWSVSGPAELSATIIGAVSIVHSIKVDLVQISATVTMHLQKPFAEHVWYAEGPLQLMP